MGSFGQRRVAVTGLGVVSSLGRDVPAMFGALCRGESGIRPIRCFDVTQCLSQVGGTIDDFDGTSVITDLNGRRMLRIADRVQAMGLCAADLAYRDAALVADDVAGDRLGVHFGVGRGGARVAATVAAKLLEEAATWQGRHYRTPEEAYDGLTRDLVRVLQSIRPTDHLQQCPSLLSSYVAIRHQARGPILTNVNLCSAGAQAIGEAAWVIARGDADVMITGGSDSMLNPAELAAFCALDAVSARNEDGPAACKPFDLRRDGCVLGEGAAAVVLEELGHARARGARVYAELLGYGASSDAHKVTAPPDDGHGAVLAMRRALDHAGVPPEAVGHINAHGTATMLNDRVETAAIKRVFGRHAYRMPVVSTKSMTGHLIAAAGALEAVIAVCSLAEKRVPPTINLQVPDPQCDLDYVSEGRWRPLPDVEVVLSNSFAIGGSNACLAFGNAA